MLDDNYKERVLLLGDNNSRGVSNFYVNKKL
nr:MAG TPA: hypothetical protein [Caudoviricetes sp.]